MKIFYNKKYIKSQYLFDSDSYFKNEQILHS